MSKTTTKTQNVLITGASRGFGFLIARSLRKAGFGVVAAMRDPDGKNKEPAKTLKAEGAHVVALDVTDDKSVEKGIAEAIKLAGGIDAVVNNAGIGGIGWVDTFTIEDFKRLFEVNVFGVQRVNRAVLPHMKANGGGTLIQVSSLLGRFVLPFFGPYNATKYAVEALADNYRLEGAAYGIQSLIVEPGAFGTDFGDSIIGASDKARIASYGEQKNAPEKSMEGFKDSIKGPKAPPPQMVADAIVKLLQTPAEKRPFRTTVDGLGMSGPIDAINAATEKSVNQIYGNFGISAALKKKAA
jgi:NAD(P)-dependent dehydrogenase (short-subunit alcohol dehydrogenase family)